LIGDLLLAWISETGAGSIANLRSRMEWLARTENLQAHDGFTGQWIRDLASLGHCEVDWKHDTWSVAPPVITRLPLSDGLAVLAGARRPRLMRAIEEAEIYVELVGRSGSEGRIPDPSTVLLPFDDPSDLESIAAAIGTSYSGCAAEEISRALTPNTPSTPAAPPAYSSEIDHLTAFLPRKWTPVSAKNPLLPDGLYREEIQGRWQYTLRRSGEWFACELAAGVFAELARGGDNVMRWRPDIQNLSRVGTVFIDWGAPLPPLQSRALTLCSGFTPRIGTTAKTTIYDNVSLEIAGRVCESLGQTLQTIN